MMFRLAVVAATAAATIGAAPPQHANLGTAIAECHGEYDYAQLLPPNPDGLGLDPGGSACSALR